MRKLVPFFGPAIEALVKPNLNINRRRIFQRTAAIVGGGTALSALVIPAEAEADPNDISGLWQSVVSATDNSFPPFQAFELFGGGLWIGSGQTDLTPAALESSLWGIFKKVGGQTFHNIGRFWTYSPASVPTGYASVDEIATLSADGKLYHAQAALRFYDNNGILLSPPTTILDNGVRIA